MARTLLDRSAPFVRAVLAIIEHGVDHEDAIAALVAAEKRHGIRVLREESTGSLAGTWVPVRTPRPSLREFYALLASFPSARDGRFDDDELAAFDCRRSALYRDGDEDQTPDAPLFAFLSETSLLLGGLDFSNDHWIEFPGGAVGSWTQRAWGACLDRWARDAERRGTLHQPWLARLDGTFFTYYLHDAEPHYEAWCTTTREVIRRKCERQLDE